MRRRTFLAGSCAPLMRAAAPVRPNFLILLADDLGVRDLGCYGNPLVETPAIDQLAAQGMRFTNAFSAGPVCSPTRASLQTGLYPARVGINCVTNPMRRPWAVLKPPPNRWNLPREMPTLAEMLTPAGYHCGLIGKWHLGEEAGNDPWDRGYERLPAPDASRHGEAVERFAAANPHKGVGTQTVQAISFLERNRANPFLCFVNYNLPHLPLTARSELIEKYAAKPRPAGLDMAPGYAAMVHVMDESIALILAALDRLDLAPNTMVWFLSDNGGVIVDYHALGPITTSNAPFRGEKGGLYDGGIRIPSIVRWPGRVTPGSTASVRCITNDLAPTLLTAAGVTPLESDGVPLVSTLEGSGEPEARDLFWHYPFYHHSTPASAVRSGAWKLIEFYETNSVELYNLASDPGERRNVAGEMPERAAELRKRLATWRAEVGAAMPAANADFNPSKAYLWGQRPAKPWLPAPGGMVDMLRECSVFYDLAPARAR